MSEFCVKRSKMTALRTPLADGECDADDEAPGEVVSSRKSVGRSDGATASDRDVPSDAVRCRLTEMGENGATDVAGGMAMRGASMGVTGAELEGVCWDQP